jgi:LPXTG-motif cell wall-anchored protein
MDAWRLQRRRLALTPGSYTVALSLAAGQGTAAQVPVTVDVAAGQTVVQHRFFRSPTQAEVVVAPPRTPVVVPTTLPATGAHDAEAWPWLTLATLLMGAGVTLRRTAG